eukprot:s837_g1.t1
MGRPRLRFSHLLRQYFPRRLKWSEESKRRLGLLCGHAGYVTGLFEYVMTDILHLRIFALTGCALIVSFQALQPRRQWISVSWNSIYCAVNLFHISLLLQERPRSLRKEEEELQRVLGEHVLHQQILALSEAGEWQCLCGGLLVEEGQEQSPQAWHSVTSAFTLCGRRGTYGTGLALVARLVAAGPGLAPRPFVRQAWHLATSAFILCGRRGAR